ncbi:MAG: bifunctional tetrahydrofolate synthase/dihydrofolate synthase [Gammaproteobacteria bacterium]|nr:bifunctional tetrahydrofolate synthase/dihydrofolate synthase [Gammaproteobacteria bacterium]
MFHAETLAEWLSFIEAQHPQGQAGIELGLERVGWVLAAMGLSSRLPFPVITVGGTNGKGSSVAMLEAILRAAGHRVGAYTSPHLLRYNERVRLDGKAVADELLVRALAQVEAVRGTVPLTYFEFGTLAALAVLVGARVDVAILEVGMGGRLDAVNVVDADAALITNVALDHTEWLGADREAIGREKAGILRAGQWAVVAEAEPPLSVLDHAQGLGLRLWRRGIDFDLTREERGWIWRGPQDAYALPLPALPGGHQLDNAAGVVMLLEGLREYLPWTIEHLRTGLAMVRHPGRLECVRQDGVPVWLDVAHNPAGVEALARAMAEQSTQGRTLAVFSALADKDAVGMACALAGQVDAWYVAGLSGPRGREVDALADLLRQVGLPVAGAWPRPAMAYNAALSEAGTGDRLLVFGSFLCVADILDHIHSSDLKA